MSFHWTWFDDHHGKIWPLTRKQLFSGLGVFWWIMFLSILSDCKDTFLTWFFAITEAGTSKKHIFPRHTLWIPHSAPVESEGWTKWLNFCPKWPVFHAFQWGSWTNIGILPQKNDFSHCPIGLQWRKNTFLWKYFDVDPGNGCKENLRVSFPLIFHRLTLHFKGKLTLRSSLQLAPGPQMSPLKGQTKRRPFISLHSVLLSVLGGVFWILVRWRL